MSGDYKSEVREGQRVDWAIFVVIDIANVAITVLGKLWMKRQTVNGLHFELGLVAVQARNEFVGIEQ